MAKSKCVPTNGPSTTGIVSGKGRGVCQPRTPAVKSTPKGVSKK